MGRHDLVVAAPFFVLTVLAGKSDTLRLRRMGKVSPLLLLRNIIQPTNFFITHLRKVWLHHTTTGSRHATRNNNIPHLVGSMGRTTGQYIANNPYFIKQQPKLKAVLYIGAA